MRKKYLSALLFGALLFASAGTFTSCKDYDDDIKNLQGEIDGTEASLTEKLTAVESSISSLQSAQTTMQGAIDAAQKAADDAQASADAAAQAAADAALAATEAQKAAIEEAAAQLEAAKTELTDLIQKGDAAAQAEIDAVNAEIAKIQGSIQALQAFQGTTEETLKNLADADAQLQTSLAGVEADLAEVANRVGKLETAVKTQEDALAAYKTENAVDLADIDAQLAALNEAVQKLAGLEPDDLVNMKDDITTLEGQVSELNNAIVDINENLATLYTAVYKGITHVALVGGYCVETGKSYSAYELKLLSDIAVQSYTFGSDKYGDTEIKHMKGATVTDGVTFVKGERMKQTAHALLRISPANATISTGDIHLVDSKGNDLVGMGLVEVTAVNVFDGTLEAPKEPLTRADAVISGVTGLVEVEFQVGPKADEQGYDFDGEFVDAVTVKDAKGEDHSKAFAVKIQQLKDIPATGEGTTAETIARNVVSAYTLNLDPTDKNDNAGNLKFKLYTDINQPSYWYEINNRNDGNDDEKNGSVEYKWKDGVDAELVYGATANSTTTADPAVFEDRRESQQTFNVKAGETFYVDLSDMNKSNDDYNPVVKYFYIVLDRDFVDRTGDQDSELAAWDSYESKIEGINKVYTVTDPANAVASMKIDIPYSDVIGFRVYAANADGSLVDPDGKAFYVQVGEPAAAMEVPTQDIVANINPGEMKSNFYNVANLQGWKDMIAAAEAAAKANKLSDIDVQLVLDSDMDEAIRGDKGDVDDHTKLDDVFDLELYKNSNAGQVSRYISSGVATTVPLSILKDIKNIKIVFHKQAKELVDEHTYTGDVTFKIYTGASDGGTTTTIGTMDLSAKKVMPTVPTGYSAKTNQIVNGKYLCYVLPDATNTALPNNGKMDGYMWLTRSFNLKTDFQNWAPDGKAVYALDQHYTFKFTDAAYNADNELEDNKVTWTTDGTDAYKLQLDNSFIENGKDYATTVEYNYGDISYVYDEVTNKFEVKNWTKEIDSFTTNFRCIANSETQTWNWVKDSKFLNKAGEGQLTYGVNVKGTTGNPFYLTAIQGKNSYDNTKYGLTFDKFWETDIIDNKWSPDDVDNKITKVELITKANGRVNEYFVPSIATGMARVEFTATDEAAPQADVASELQITFKDKFGHNVVVKLPMNVHIDKGE